MHLKITWSTCRFRRTSTLEGLPYKNQAPKRCSQATFSTKPSPTKASIRSLSLSCARLPLKEAHISLLSCILLSKEDAYITLSSLLLALVFLPLKKAQACNQGKGGIYALFAQYFQSYKRRQEKAKNYLHFQSKEVWVQQKAKQVQKLQPSKSPKCSPL